MELLPSPPVSGDPDPDIKAKTSLDAQVSWLLHTLRLDYQGRGRSIPWQTFPFSHAQYRTFKLHLEADEPFAGHVRHNVRLNYDWDAEEATIQMSPTTVHEMFCSLLHRRISDRLTTTVVAHPELRDLIDGVIDLRTRKLELLPKASNAPDAESPHSPDLQYEHETESWPAVVIEVAFSQKRANLPRLAYLYISGSRSCTRVVIGVDLEYQTPRQRQQGQPTEARMFIWRKRTVAARDDPSKQVNDVVLTYDEPFRTAAGVAVAGAAELLLSDFVPRQSLPSFATDLPIVLQNSELAADLARAEAWQRKHEMAVEQLRSPSPGWQEWND